MPAGHYRPVHGLFSRKRTLTALSSLFMASAVWLAVPSTTEACGGTFCDAGPTVMPVDQTGENVMFVVADGQVEAHIQIQYTGDPERFAWIVPVMAEPTVEVGSDLLFTELQNSTVPTFTVNTRTEDCGLSGGGGSSGNSGGGGGGCGATPREEPLAGFGDDAPSLDDDLDEDPTVRQRELAGSYEYVVLEGGSLNGIVRWLDENGFAQDEDAPPILQEYIDEGFLFVAFKLRSGHNVDQIHPIVLRYPGTEACVPMRLTRIAARDDMGVRAFFLGEDRVVPTNFRHVQLNPLKFNWTSAGSNYEEVVTRAVDEDGADGHAFVTEYAGNSNVVSTSTFNSSRWRSEPFRDAQPDNLTALLADSNLMTCTLTDCFPAHPLVPSLLQTYVPPPPGVDPKDFYTCSNCYADWEPENTSAAGTQGETAAEATGSDGDTDGTTGGSNTSGGSGSTAANTDTDTDSTDTDTDTEGATPADTDDGSSETDTDDGSSETDDGGTDEPPPAPTAWPESWDTDGLADALREQVIEPSQHAAALVHKYPYLTRMYTTLSPSEMTRDPLFAESSLLPDVGNVRAATRFRRCNGPDRVELASGQTIWFTDDDTPPTFSDMPYARVIEEYFTGAPMTIRDHSEAIDAELASWNEEHEGPFITPDDELVDQDEDDDDSWCSCTSTESVRGSGTMTLLLLFGLCARKRRFA